MKESTSVAHSLMPRKLETSSASHVAGSSPPPPPPSLLPTFRDRGVAPVESTRRGITFTGAVEAAAGAAFSSDA